MRGGRRPPQDKSEALPETPQPKDLWRESPAARKLEPKQPKVVDLLLQLVRAKLERVCGLQHYIPDVPDLRLVQTNHCEVIDLHRYGRGGQVRGWRVIVEMWHLRCRASSNPREECLAKPQSVRPAHRHRPELRVDDLAGGRKAIDKINAKISACESRQTEIGP